MFCTTFPEKKNIYKTIKKNFTFENVNRLSHQTIQI